MNAPTASTPASAKAAPSKNVRHIKRHPFKAILSGILLGVGMMLLVMVYAKAPFGSITPWICLGSGVIAGLVLGLFGPARKHR
jgi:hypothetical protein